MEPSDRAAMQQPPPPPAWFGWVLQALRDVGFPAFVALYLLLGQTPMMAELRDAVRELVQVVREMKMGGPR